MARILIVGGGGRGVSFAGRLIGEGHAVRIVTREEGRREAIEGVGAECFIGTPDRLLTLGGALEHVTIVCWLLATATGEVETVAALHGSRLERFVTSVVDTTVRGFVYEGGGTALDGALLKEGERIARRGTSRNAIPLAVLRSDPRQEEIWVEEALEAVRMLVGG